MLFDISPRPSTTMDERLTIPLLETPTIPPPTDILAPSPETSNHKDELTIPLLETPTVQPPTDILAPSPEPSSHNDSLTTDFSVASLWSPGSCEDNLPGGWSSHKKLIMASPRFYLGIPDEEIRVVKLVTEYSPLSVCYVLLTLKKIRLYKIIRRFLSQCWSCFENF